MALCNLVKRLHSAIIPCLKCDDGELVTTDYDKANIFSDYFAEVFSNDNGILPNALNGDGYSKLDGFHCDVRPMIKIVKNLRSDSSPDMFTPFFLKNIINC